MEIRFLGGTGTVTGSRFLVRTRSATVLVDCGLFQGLKQLRRRNWEAFPVDPRELDAVVLTHAHLDHSGYLPRLIREGFRGAIHCTPGTRALCEVLLPDSGHLQEEEAAFANRHGISKHVPALPLYTRREAALSLERFAPVPYGRRQIVASGVEIAFEPAGHIPGAAMVRLDAAGRSVLFSGDLGRPDDPLLPAPARPAAADYLLVESTYGDRVHSRRDLLEELAEPIARTVERGGAIVIPAFAVGRTQLLLYCLHRLKTERRIPDVPIYLDSPMAVRATEIFRQLHAEHRLSREECDAVAATASVVESVEESKAIDRMRYPFIVISASGMATGGRVIHHLKALAPNHRNTILLVGYQAAGSRGAALAGGAKAIKIHGAYVPVRAEVVQLDAFSAHADSEEILAWLEGFTAAPRETFVVHGEPVAADALRLRIEERLGWTARVPEHLETVQLD